MLSGRAKTALHCPDRRCSHLAEVCALRAALVHPAFKVLAQTPFPEMIGSGEEEAHSQRIGGLSALKQTPCRDRLYRGGPGPESTSCSTRLPLSAIQSTSRLPTRPHMLIDPLLPRHLFVRVSSFETPQTLPVARPWRCHGPVEVDSRAHHGGTRLPGSRTETLSEVVDDLSNRPPPMPEGVKSGIVRNESGGSWHDYSP